MGGVQDDYRRIRDLLQRLESTLETLRGLSLVTDHLLESNRLGEQLSAVTLDTYAAQLRVVNHARAQMDGMVREYWSLIGRAGSP